MKRRGGALMAKQTAAARARTQARYRLSAKGKAASACYKRSAKGKAANVRYRHSPKGRATSARADRSAKGIARRARAKARNRARESARHSFVPRRQLRMQRTHADAMRSCRARGAFRRVAQTFMPATALAAIVSRRLNKR